MEHLTLSDLCVIIPLLEKELDQIHADIESENYEISDDAAELSVPEVNNQRTGSEIHIHLLL